MTGFRAMVRRARWTLVISFPSVFGIGTAAGQGLSGLGFMPGESTFSVFSIDPATGARTLLLPTGATSLAGVPIAFDPATRRLFFQTDSALYTADLAGGVVSQVPQASCCPFLFFAGPGVAVVVPILGSFTLVLLTAALAVVGW